MCTPAAVTAIASSQSGCTNLHAHSSRREFQDAILKTPYTMGCSLHVLPQSITEQASMLCGTLTRAEHTALLVLPAELGPRQSTMAAGWTTVTDTAGCKGSCHFHLGNLPSEGLKQLLCLG